MEEREGFFCVPSSASNSQDSGEHRKSRGQYFVVDNPRDKNGEMKDSSAIRSPKGSKYSRERHFLSSLQLFGPKFPVESVADQWEIKGGGILSPGAMQTIMLRR